MGQLTNQYVSQSYQGLLNLENEQTGVTSTLQYVTDGVGNKIPMQVSTSSIVISGSFYGDGSNLTGITIDSGSFVTTSSFNAFSSSVDTSITALDSSVSALNLETGSLQSQIDALATTGSLSSLSASIAVTDAAQNARLSSLESETGSYAKQIDLSNLSSSIAVTDANQSAAISSLVSHTGSYATTGSNTFNGNQDINGSITVQDIVNTDNIQSPGNLVIEQASHGQMTVGIPNGTLKLKGSQVQLDGGITSFNTGIVSGYTYGWNIDNGNQDFILKDANVKVTGSVDITGTITAESASFTYLKTIYETSSVVYSSGSNIFGDAANDTQTLYGTVDVKTGPLLVSGNLRVSGAYHEVKGNADFYPNQWVGVNGGLKVIDGELRVENSDILQISGDTYVGNTLYASKIRPNSAAGISIDGNGSPVSVTSSLVAANGITGSLQGTASYATQALSASWAPMPDVSGYATTASVNALSSSIASTDAAQNGRLNSIESKTGSYITSAQTSSMSVLSASFAQNAVSAAWAPSVAINTGSFATTGSNTFNGNQVINGNLSMTGAFAVNGSSSLQYTDLSGSLNVPKYSEISIFGDDTVGGQPGALRFYSSSFTPLRWINFQSRPQGQGDLAISDFPSNNHFMFFGVQNHDIQFEAPLMSTSSAAPILVKNGLSVGINNLSTDRSLTVTGSLGVTGSINLTGSFRTNQDILVNNVMTVGVGSGNFPSNVAIGSGSLSSNTMGTANIGLGYETLKFNTSGANNIAIGVNALRNGAFTGNTLNTAIGGGALQNLASGSATPILATISQNTIIGGSAGQFMTSGSRNTAIGSFAMQSADATERNTAIGRGALSQVGSASDPLGAGSQYNTAIGHNAGFAFRSGSNNLIVFGGAVAGEGLQYGSKNTIIGQYANIPTTGNSMTIIGQNIASANLTGLTSGGVIVADGSGNTAFSKASSTSPFTIPSTVNMGATSGDTHNVTGKLNVTNGITGSLQGTASYATQALSSSYATQALSASWAPSVSIDTGSFATTGSNSFIGTENITGSLNVSGSQSTIIGNLNVTGNTFMTGSGYVLNVQADAKFQRLHFDTSPFVTGTLSNLGALRYNSNDNFSLTNYAKGAFPSGAYVELDCYTGSNYYSVFLNARGGGIDTKGLKVENSAGITTTNITTDYTNISGALSVTGSITGTLIGSASYATQALSASYAPMPSVSNLATTGSNTFNGSQIISGSVQGSVNAVSIASNTGSIDSTAGNFFTLGLQPAANTHVKLNSVKPGQTINVLVSTAAGGTVTFENNIKQPSGSAYVPTSGTSKDILTFVAFDASTVYLANVKNLI